MSQCLYVHTLNLFSKHSNHTTQAWERTTLILVFVVLSRDQPPDAVRTEDGVESEAGYEEDGEHKQPVDALDRNRRQRSDAVVFLNGLIRACFKTWREKSESLHDE